MTLENQIHDMNKSNNNNNNWTWIRKILIHYWTWLNFFMYWSETGKVLRLTYWIWNEFIIYRTWT